MAFTFFYLSLFSWGFCFLFCYFSPLKCWAHFSPDVSVPCCSCLPCCHSCCAGIWVVGPNPCTCSQPCVCQSSGEHLFWISSVCLTEEGLRNEGTGGSLLCQALVISAEQYSFWKTKVVSLADGCNHHASAALPKTTGGPRGCPLPSSSVLAHCLASGLSVPSHHSTLHCCRENPERTKIDGISSAEWVSWPGVRTFPFLWSLAETQKLLLMSTATNWFSWPNVTLLFTSASIVPSFPAPYRHYHVWCFRQHSCSILLPKCPLTQTVKCFNIYFSGIKRIKE